jgi:hypothetical protein
MTLLSQNNAFGLVSGVSRRPKFSTTTRRARETLWEYNYWYALRILRDLPLILIL